MRRALVAVAAVLAFVAVSAGVARVLAASSTERDAAVDAVKARTGADVEVLRVDGAARFPLSEGTSTVRVAWRAGRRLPVVQCVRLRRDGGLVSGFEVRVLSLSAPIGREESC